MLDWLIRTGRSNRSARVPAVASPRSLQNLQNLQNLQIGRHAQNDRSRSGSGCHGASRANGTFERYNQSNDCTVTGKATPWHESANDPGTKVPTPLCGASTTEHELVASNGGSTTATAEAAHCALPTAPGDNGDNSRCSESNAAVYTGPTELEPPQPSGARAILQHISRVCTSTNMLLCGCLLPKREQLGVPEQQPERVLPVLPGQMHAEHSADGESDTPQPDGGSL